MDELAKAIRKTARMRCSLVPGTGFALLGYPLPAYLGFTCGAVSIAALMAVSFFPSTLMAWIALLSLLGVLVFWFAEYITVGHVTIHPSGESSSASRHFFWVCVLTYSAAIVAGGCLLLNFGSLQARGDGMIPVVYAGERLLYHKHVATADLVPGNLCTFLVSPDSSWGRPGDVVLARILAAPGDTIAIRDGRYQVNGKDSGREVSPVGHYPVVVDVPELPQQITVPPDCYFVVQEQPSKALDSRTMSWARRQNVLATKLWLLSTRGLIKALH